MTDQFEYPQQPKKELTREEMVTKIAWMGAAGLVLFFLIFTTLRPNLDGIHPYDRCSYFAYWINHGGTIAKCQAIEEQAMLERVRNGY